MFLRFMLFGANHRVVTLFLLVLFSVLSAVGLPDLKVDTSFNSLISDSNPDKPVYDRIVNRFGSDNKTIFYLRDPDLWTPARLADLKNIHDSLQSLPYVSEVESLFSARTVGYSQGAVTFGPLLGEVPEIPEKIAQIQNKAVQDQLLVHNLISPNGQVTAITVSVVDPQQQEGFEERVHGAFERIIQEQGGAFQEIFQVGSPRVTAEIKDNLYSDMVTLAPLSGLLLILSILFFLRSFLAALIPLTTSAICLLWTFGLMGWLGIPINILSAMLPSLVVVIGSTEDTFMLSAYFQGNPGKGREGRRQAIYFMMKHMGVPLFLTTLTTALGFASNAMSSISLIQDFAYAATLAMAINAVVTVLVIPLMLVTFGPVKKNVGAASLGQKGWAANLAVELEGLIHHYPKSILFVTLLVTGSFLYQAASLKVTNDPLSYFKTDQPLIVQTDLIHEDLAGMKVFFIHLESQKEGVFRDPAYLGKLVKIEDYMDQQGIYDSHLSLVDVLSRVNQVFHRNDSRFFTLPENREMIEQYLLFFDPEDLSDYVSEDYRQAIIMVRHNVHDSHTLNRYIRDLKHTVQRFSGTGVNASVVGENLMINSAAQNLMLGQMESLAMLLGVIFIIMSGMFTSLKGGLISLVPNLIPIIMVFGLMALLDIPINPGTAMLAVIAIGIGIDNTIHLLSRYNEECRLTSNLWLAVRRTVRAEVVPVVTTSFSLLLGFSVLTFSNFTIIAQFGALSAAAMFFALVADLLVTPVIMARVRLIGITQILGLSIQKDVLDKSPLFHGMTKFQIKRAVLISEMRTFASGDLVVKQGSIGRSMALILSGNVDIIRHANGEAMKVAVLGPGQIFGEIGFVQETERTADVVAASEVEVLIFDYKTMNQKMKFFPHIIANLNLNISRVLANRLVETVAKSMAAQAPKPSPPAPSPPPK
ncbi:MAG: MMPL family transporter [Magnetococcales bacterium]|nr:MMPL family transporter [Magnetococcales bacterium]